jgi:hypothetical protein
MDRRKLAREHAVWPAELRPDCASRNGYFRFAFGLFIQRRPDTYDEPAQDNENSSDHDPRTANRTTARDVACNLMPALSTQFGQHSQIEHKKTSVRCGGLTKRHPNGRS